MTEISNMLGLPWMQNMTDAQVEAEYKLHWKNMSVSTLKKIIDISLSEKTTSSEYDINQQDKQFQRTPLHWAVLYTKDPEVVIALLGMYTLDAKIQDRDNNMAFDFAIKNDVVYYDPRAMALLQNASGVPNIPASR